MYSQYYGSAYSKIAPELHKGETPTPPSDWWTFGAVIYEMIYGCTPFYHQFNHDLAKLKLSEDALLFPINIKCSENLKDLLKALLHTDPRERLGWKDGAREIRSHPWFKQDEDDLPWEDMNVVENRSLPEDEAKGLISKLKKDKFDLQLCIFMLCSI